MSKMKKIIVTTICFTFVTLSFAQVKQYIIPNLVEDKCIPIPYKNQRLDGLYGKRLNILVEKGLLGYDLNSYLEAYYGERIAEWPTGEYLGKYFIATLKMYEYTNSTALKNQLERILKTWKETMPEDGYQSIRMNKSQTYKNSSKNHPG